ncbi:hypothetical protein PR202_gb15037 [Eleusine coracana subsp. coracana]|uniref:Beta-glucosidase n=1 Tax=Eleusine coracana subsp. coracana TaxID=191504 RepID=A0AAV5EUM9_ELECO|nr:hypothetical protein PR202_gb15037 [Eleusine coracana subsp. coracana]
MGAELVWLALVLAHGLLPCASSVHRGDFTPNFLFGTSTSAYQVEGAYLEDNKGLSNWDVFAHKTGGRFGNVNPDGVAFYNALIDALLQKGIEPFVTICHYDIPQELAMRYGGWLSPEIQAIHGRSQHDPVTCNCCQHLQEKLSDPVDGDARVASSAVRDDGVPIGEPTGAPQFYSVPEGMEQTVLYFKNRYNNTPIYITENGTISFSLPSHFFSGYAQASNSNMTAMDFINDTRRIDYIGDYLTFLASAIRKGADVRGYFVWSLLDDFEWTSGYTLRFGLYHVDFETLKRTPKLSVKWYRDFLKGSLMGAWLRDDDSQLQRYSA